MTKDEIKTIAIEFGFAINQDIFGFADRVLGEQFEQLQKEGWRQCAKGQHTSQFCGQLEAAVKAERDTWPNLQPVITWLENGGDPKDAAKELRIYDEAICEAWWNDSDVLEWRCVLSALHDA